MTQDDIIEMARQAGGREMVSALTHPNGPTTAVKFHLESGTLEAFVKLVAAKEREACADLCDSEKKWWDGMSHSEKDIYQAIDNISALIRARGQ